MDTDRNLLFGVLALQADLIDSQQFLEACLLWTRRKDVSLADLLVERGWLLPDDRAHVDYLVERRLGKHDGDVLACLATVPDDVRHSLLALNDPALQQSLAESAALQPPDLAATVDHVPGPGERYTRIGLHATGGIGRVWRAHDCDLRREVALKEIRPERAGDPCIRARFLQEARITGQLEHPGIVPVYELIRQPGGQQPFYTMRFVKGRTLSDAVQAFHQARRAGRSDSLQFLNLLNAFVAICNTIAYAHSRGVIHRDLKGQNVIVGDFGEVVVLDWGLAKLVDHPENESAAVSDTRDREEPSDSGLTVQGQTVGTPAYMAPEQAAGRPDLIDRRTDVYGLGAVLYEILTGGAPFSGPDTGVVLRRVQDEAPAAPRQLWPEVPPALEVVCLRALAKRPEDRPAAAADLAREVQGWQEFERRKAEEALRASEALYHSLVETIPLSVWRKDRQGRFIFANKRFCDSLGKPLDQVIGKTDFHFFPPELAAKYRADDARVHETGVIVAMAEDHVTAAGEKLYVQVVKAPVFDAQGQVIGTQGIFWDLTEWKRTEEELRKSRERFELAVQGSQDGLWDWDLTTDEVYYSPRYKAMLGYKDHEFPNRSEEWARRVHPEDLDRVRAELRDHFRSRESLSWVEFRMRHKDGSYRWIRSRAFVLRDPTSGRVYRMAGSHEDITDRKTAEEALAHERYLLNSLMDRIPDLIYFKDREGRYIRVNRSLAAMFGLGDPTQVLGKRVRDLVTAEYAQYAEAEDAEIFRTGQPVVNRDARVTFANGRVMWVSTTKMPLRDPQGTIIGTCGIARDIGERKRAEEALRQSEERYRSVIAAMQDGIVILDPDGSIRSCNAAAERILGLSAEQIMGRTPHDPRWRAIHEDGSPFPGETHPPMVTLRTGQPCTDVVMGVHKPDGTLTWITVNAQPLFQADGRTLAGVVASFEDITDRKAMIDRFANR
jgi:PAS domain S-box-containing protein